MSQRGEIYLTNLERMVESALDTLRIPYHRQYSTRTGFVLDFALPDIKVDLEVDGPFHDTDKSRKRDRFRNLQVRREGWRVVRIHHTELDAAADVPSLLLAKLQPFLS